MWPILFSLGPLTFHTYGLMVAIGFLAGFVWAKKEFTARGMTADFQDRLLTHLMVWGIVGARIFYFATEKFQPLKSDPLMFFRIWEGGLVYYGGFIGACVALLIIAQRKNLSLLMLTDALAGPLLLAQAFGRLGCFGAGCCYGKIFSGPWAVQFHNPDSLAPLGISLHPTQLYESLGLVLLVGGLLLLRRRITIPGLGLIYYLLSYSTLRFVVEIFRGDFRGPTVGMLSPSQLISCVCFALGLGAIVYAKKERKKTSHQN